MKLLLIATFLGNFYGTSYRSVPNQTDSSPNFTSTGEHVCSHGIAVSQDLLENNGGPIEYGDVVYIEGLGFKVVNDTMNKRHKNSFDVWVATYKEEKAFDQRYGRKKFKMWVIKKGSIEAKFKLKDTYEMR